MKQVMNYHKDNGLLNMIRRTDPMITDSALTYPTQKIPNYHDDRFSLVVLKKTTYEKYTIEEIREKRIMDYGIVYSYDELERMGFVIKYAGQDTCYEDKK